MKPWILAPALALAGCSSLIHEPFNIDGKDASSLSIDAKQRVILVSHEVPHNGGTKRVVCAEPSPDAIVAAAASLAGSADIPGQVKAGLSGSSSESAASIGLRTQSIQLLRDGTYRACEAYMNGVIGEREYRAILHAYGDLLVTLTAIEGITGPVAAPAVSIAAGTGAASANAGTPSANGGGSTANTSFQQVSSSGGVDKDVAAQIVALVQAYNKTQALKNCLFYSAEIDGENPAPFFDDKRIGLCEKALALLAR